MPTHTLGTDQHYYGTGAYYVPPREPVEGSSPHPLARPPYNPLPPPVSGVTASAAGTGSTAPAGLASALPAGVSSGSVLGKVRDFFQKPEVIRTLKILTVALVVGGLIAASVFTFGAAVPLVAGLTVASTASSVAGGFALLGVGAGLALGSVFAIFVARLTKMYKATEDNVGDTLGFLGVTFLGTAAGVGLLAASGGYAGFGGLVAAKAAMGTVGTGLVFGSGAVFVKMFLERDG